MGKIPKVLVMPEDYEASEIASLYVREADEKDLINYVFVDVHLMLGDEA